MCLSVVASERTIRHLDTILIHHEKSKIKALQSSPTNGPMNLWITLFETWCSHRYKEGFIDTEGYNEHRIVCVYPLLYNSYNKIRLYMLLSYFFVTENQFDLYTQTY